MLALVSLRLLPHLFPLGQHLSLQSPACLRRLSSARLCEACSVHDGRSLASHRVFRLLLSQQESGLLLRPCSRAKLIFGLQKFTPVGRCELLAKPGGSLFKAAYRRPHGDGVSSLCLFGHGANAIVGHLLLIPTELSRLLRRRELRLVPERICDHLRLENGVLCSLPMPSVGFGLQEGNPSEHFALSGQEHRLADRYRRDEGWSTSQH